MTAKRKKGGVGRPVIMAREFRVTSARFNISSRAEKLRGLEPALASSAWLHLNGDCDEPVRDVKSITLTVHPEKEWKRAPLGPPSIGGIIQFRPELQAIVYVPFFEFEFAWSLAASDQLKFVYLAFTEPRDRHSFIVSVSFSNKSEDDET